jgi:two-component system NtrC family sensor kinase
VGGDIRSDVPDETGSLSAAAFEASPIAILVTDEAGRIVLVNPAAEEVSGYRREELMGKSIEGLVPERFRERHLKLRKAYTAEARTRRMFSAPGIYFLRKDGTEVAVEIGLNPIQTPDGSFTVSSIVDADELKRARSLVAAANQMASVHTLAAGVAHGINNPLAYVMGNLSFALGELERVCAPSGEATEERKVADPSIPLPHMFLEIREALAHAKEGSARIRDLVIDLLAFSSGPSAETVVFDLHPVLESALNLTVSEIRRRARLVKQYDEVPRVRGDASSLVRVLFNLLTNAVESIPENEKERNEIRLATWTDAGGSAVIEVRDTGSGIQPETVDRIFEPFYTTKAFGSRTGLGLAIAYGIVKSMGGEIEVTSAAGRGSAFRVRLPASLTADSAGPLVT